MYKFDWFDLLIKVALIPALPIIGAYKLLSWFVRSVIKETGKGLVKVTAKVLVTVVVLMVIGTTLSQ